MKRIAWITDIHLNFLPAEACAAFLDELADLNLDGLIISGDIAESHDVADYLCASQRRSVAKCTLCWAITTFIIGSIRGVRAAMDALSARQPRLHYLTSRGPIELHRRGPGRSRRLGRRPAGRLPALADLPA